MGVARYYDESKNPTGRARLAGIPLRDLTDEEFAALTKRQQESVDASELYRKTKPPTGAKPAPAKKKTGATPAEQPAPVADEPTVITTEEAANG